MSALVASIALFVIISALLSLLGFKFWVQPKAALERVMGEVEIAQQTVRHPSLGFRDLLTKIGNMVPANPADVGILQKRLLTAGVRNSRALQVLYGVKGSLALGFTLLSSGLIFGLDQVQKVAPPALIRVLVAAGVLLYAGVGVAGMLLGGNYLDYGVLRHDPVHGQHLGILLIEFGVGTTVASAMITIFFIFAGQDAGATEE